MDTNSPENGIEITNEVTQGIRNDLESSPEEESVVVPTAIAPENAVEEEKEARTDALQPNAQASDGEEIASDVATIASHVENVPSASDEEIAAKMQKRARKMSRRRRRKQAKLMRILNWEDGKDIRYRGVLSYRALRIIAWLFFLASQAGVLIAFAAKMDAGFAKQVGAWATILPLLRNFMTPLFLMAAFATILNNSRKFSSLLLTYGGFAIVFYALFCLLHDRYMVGIMMVMGDMTREDAVGMVDSMITLLCKNGYFSFNIFIDLFICTLFTFFMVYRPKKVFVGKWLIVFRLFAILPFAYEIGSIVVKALASLGNIVMPTHVYPLLTTKPPMTFLVFVALTFFIKKREWLYRRNGKTHEEYQAFLGTNLNSLQFSTFVTIQFSVVAFLDVILAIIVSAAIAPRFAYAEDALLASVTAVSSWGLGACLPLLLVTPFIMLFSYTRTHKDTKMDLIINLLGIIGLVLIYLEGLYQAAIYEIDVLKGFLEGMMGA